MRIERRQFRWGAGVLGFVAAFVAGCATTGGPGRGSSGIAADGVPATRAARVTLARELVGRGDWGRAFAMLDGLHRDWPEDAEVLTLRGIVYRERGLFSEAEVDLKAAVAAAPALAEAHAALGILYDLEMREDAEAQHREAVRLAPNNAAFLNNLGFSLFLRQKYKEAVGQYDHAATLAPLSRRVRTNLGFACAAIGDMRRAAREFQMGGTPAEAKNNLGFAYERRGDMNNAYELYAEAARLDPSSRRARSNLAHAAGAIGRPLPPDLEPAPPAQAATAQQGTSQGDSNEP